MVLSRQADFLGQVRLNLLLDGLNHILTSARDLAGREEVVM